MKLRIFFQNHSILFIFDLEFEFRDLILMEKIPHTPYLCLLLLLNFVVSVSVSVSAESIGQLQFRFRYRAETKMVVSVVHYCSMSFLYSSTRNDMLQCFVCSLIPKVNEKKGQPVRVSFRKKVLLTELVL